MYTQFHFTGTAKAFVLIIKTMYILFLYLQRKTTKVSLAKRQKYAKIGKVIVIINKQIEWEIEYMINRKAYGVRIMNKNLAILNTFFLTAV